MDGIDLFLDEVATRGPWWDIQFTPGAPRFDLTWGHPDPTLLPAEELAAAAERVFADRPWRWLSYGTSEGAGRLRQALADRLTAHAPTTPLDLVVTYGSSHGLDLVLGAVGRRGDLVLVEQPTYFLALQIIRERVADVIGLPAHTPAAASLPDVVRRLRDDGHIGRIFLYVCPTHANPTGRTMPDDERRALVEAARSHDVTIIEDDVYGELGDEPVTPLWALDPDRVIRLGSFSKTVAPGLRLGYVRAGRDDAGDMAYSGVLHSGGGANPLVAAMVADLIETGAYDTITARLGATYRRRMGALLDRIEDVHLPVGRPAGGYFAWVRGVVTEAEGGSDLDAGTVLMQRAHDRDLAVAHPASFFVDAEGWGGEPAVRVSCSLLAEADLAEASDRLASILGSGAPPDRS